MLNVNVGVLGHVDSGKTSLSKVLSTVSSTASFDKNPQSVERGITLDLGFSSFTIDVRDQPKFAALHIHTMQVTLVDCPGHASLIRTVIGGAQIVDCLMVVVDATKGIQTQTAECLVVGEVIGKPLLVALNKVDAVQGSTEDDRKETLKKMRKRLERTLMTTRWPGAPIVEVAADPGARGLHFAPPGEDGAPAPMGLKELMSSMVALVDVESLMRTREAANRGRKGFLMFVDHCFAVKGQGTVLTGTVMQGQVGVGDDLTLPDYQLTRRVKSIQVFRKSVPAAKHGDRVGVCITHFDAKEMERGVACSADAGVVSASTLIATVQKVRFHTRHVEAGQKFHISIGHSTVMGTMKFFSRVTAKATTAAATRHSDPTSASDMTDFDMTAEYDHLDSLPDASACGYDTASVTLAGHAANLQSCAVTYYAVVLLERPVTTVRGATLIASHLDTDIHATTCRLAVMGNIVRTSGLELPDAWRSIHAVRYKQKRVSIDRVVDRRTCIAKGLVKPKAGLDMKAAGAQMFADVQKFVGMHVHGMWPRDKEAVEKDHEEGGAVRGRVAPPSDGVLGTIDSAFGKTGKVRITFAEDVFVLPPAKLGGRGGRGRAGGRGGRGRGGPTSPPGQANDPVQTEIEGDEGSDTEQPEGSAEVDKTPSAPKVRLYFFAKKFPFAQHCPLQQ